MSSDPVQDLLDEFRACSKYQAPARKCDYVIRECPGCGKIMSNWSRNGEGVSHRRADAKTCSAKCRKRVSRKNIKDCYDS